MEAKECIRLGLKQVDEALNNTLEGLVPTELKWQPKSDANSIGIILFHILRIEDTFIQSFLQTKIEIWEADKWYLKFNRSIQDKGNFYTTETLASFIVPELKDSREYATAVRSRTLEYLKDIKPEKWFEKAPNLPPFPPPSKDPKGVSNPNQKSPWGDGTVGYLLVKLVTHSARHVGEISYLRGLQRGLDK